MTNKRQEIQGTGIDTESILEEIEGKLLNDFYGEKPEWYVEVSKKIADDYQLVIQEVQKTLALGDLLSEGKEWFSSRLETWGWPIFDAGLIDTAVLEKTQKDFDEVTAKNGEDFFGWFHGNIIGDHIIVSGENLYLLDLDAVPRPGRGYYDFLRALDFMLLKEEGGTAADQ